jgi:hypothetical protein
MALMVYNVDPLSARKDKDVAMYGEEFSDSRIFGF